MARPEPVLLVPSRAHLRAAIIALYGVGLVMSGNGPSGGGPPYTMHEVVAIIDDKGETDIDDIRWLWVENGAITLWMARQPPKKTATVNSVPHLLSYLRRPKDQ